jgi:hypothetical protein
LRSNTKGEAMTDFDQIGSKAGLELFLWSLPACARQDWGPIMLIEGETYGINRRSKENIICEN